MSDWYTAKEIWDIIEVTQDDKNQVKESEINLFTNPLKCETNEIIKNIFFYFTNTFNGKILKENLS